MPLPETEQLPLMSLYQMSYPVSSAGWADHFNVEFCKIILGLHDVYFS